MRPGFPSPMKTNASSEARQHRECVPKSKTGIDFIFYVRRFSLLGHFLHLAEVGSISAALKHPTHSVALPIIVRKPTLVDASTSCASGIGLVIRLRLGCKYGKNTLKLGLAGHNRCDLRNGHSADIFTIDGDDAISRADLIGEDRRRAHSGNNRALGICLIGENDAQLARRGHDGDLCPLRYGLGPARGIATAGLGPT